MGLNDEGDVTVDEGGKSFSGHWKVAGDSITVTFCHDSKTVHLASKPSPLTEVAKEILSDLVGIYLTKNLKTDGVS